MLDRVTVAPSSADVGPEINAVGAWFSEYWWTLPLSKPIMYIFVPPVLNAMPVGVASWLLTEKETESYEAKERSKSVESEYW